MMQDYHRFHFLTTAKLVSITNVPGRLYTVNPIAINSTFANVLTQNKRAICMLDTPEYGPVAFVVIGATMVCCLTRCHHVFMFMFAHVTIIVGPYCQCRLSACLPPQSMDLWLMWSLQQQQWHATCKSMQCRMHVVDVCVCNTSRDKHGSWLACACMTPLCTAFCPSE